MKAWLISLLSSKQVQGLILTGLEKVAQRTDNTIDDKVISIVRNGFDSKVNPTGVK